MATRSRFIAMLSSFLRIKILDLVSNVLHLMLVVTLISKTLELFENVTLKNNLAVENKIWIEKCIEDANLTRYKTWDNTFAYYARSKITFMCKCKEKHFNILRIKGIRAIFLQTSNYGHSLCLECAMLNLIDRDLLNHN